MLLISYFLHVTSCLAEYLYYKGARRTFIMLLYTSFYIYMFFCHCSAEIKMLNDEGFTSIYFS